jgi:hypothetical protein
VALLSLPSVLHHGERPVRDRAVVDYVGQKFGCGLRSRMLRPSCVRALTESELHTWFRRSGLSRTHDLSLSHNLPRCFCFCGTFIPSRRQIRSTRSVPTRQPARFSNAVIRRYP